MLKILSLDGGGLRGLYQIQVLKKIEKELGNLNDYFDIIIGTSVGSMLACFIRLGYDVNTIEKQYLENLRKTFTIAEIYENNFNSLKEILKKENQKVIGIEIKDGINIFKTNNKTGEKYKAHMRETLINKKINKPFYTISINISDREPKIFRVDENSSTKDIVDAIASSTALPGLFKPHEINGKFYSDGGVLYNDPSLVALSIALKIEKDASKIKILSIGTLDEINSSQNIFDTKYLKNKMLDYLTKENNFLKYIKNKSNDIDFINFVGLGSLGSYAHNYTSSFFDATNKGHREILNTIFNLFNANDNYLRINHKVTNKSLATQYLYEYTKLVFDDKELIDKIKKWV
ncbi:patatin-like phospholipase family protein [Oceanivirga salmonicida]|uniref:patatin-like phospholipase family protein n=1 Tax=Oceanivirga salmonicida TaxID=1769291 RepID=UPI000836598F|nr:patatin-like phospholipase family protein [Oceanivirga salmonicida]